MIQCNVISHCFLQALFPRHPVLRCSVWFNTTKWFLSHNFLLQYSFLLSCCNTLFSFLVGPHFESFPSPEDIGWMGWGRGDFSLLTTFNIKHCKTLQFPVVWLPLFCLLASPHHLGALVVLLDTSMLFNLLAHITLVTLSASRNSYDTCLPQYNLGNIQLSKWKIACEPQILLEHYFIATGDDSKEKNAQHCCAGMLPAE